MFIYKRNGSIVCTKCDDKGNVMRLKDYEAQKHQDDPEWFWEPWDYSENFMYICTGCNNEDFISDEE